MKYKRMWVSSVINTWDWIVWESSQTSPTTTTPTSCIMSSELSIVIISKVNVFLCNYIRSFIFCLTVGLYVICLLILVTQYAQYNVQPKRGCKSLWYKIFAGVSDSAAQQTWGVRPMSAQCWPTVHDVSPKPNQSQPNNSLNFGNHLIRILEKNWDPDPEFQKRSVSRVREQSIKLGEMIPITIRILRRGSPVSDCLPSYYYFHHFLMLGTPSYIHDVIM